MLQFVDAPFGRHASKNFGPMIKNKWGWMIMEAPSFLLIAYFAVVVGSGNTVALVLSLFWLLHYANRTFIFPFRIKSRNKLMPLFIVFSAIFFNLMNAGLNGIQLGSVSDYDVSWFYDWRFILGSCVFMIGFGINYWADEKLMNLRKPGETGYKIPRGGLFELISSPNLFGEIVEWTGFAIMAWNLPAASFAIWTFANLVPRAAAHHRFYKERFEDYPAGRKRVIPFLY